MSPISSRNSVPPSARSKRPTRFATAPVKAPFSWPNSSVSRRCSGIAAQFTGTKGPLPPGPRIRGGPGPPLPCPFPILRSGAPSPGMDATRAIVSNTRAMAALRPISRDPGRDVPPPSHPVAPLGVPRERDLRTLLHEGFQAAEKVVPGDGLREERLGSHALREQRRLEARMRDRVRKRAPHPGARAIRSTISSLTQSPDRATSEAVHSSRGKRLRERRKAWGREPPPPPARPASRKPGSTERPEGKRGCEGWSPCTVVGRRAEGGASGTRHGMPQGTS
jgi:hypothetical protein